jgi:uncharacterized protein YcbX
MTISALHYYPVKSCAGIEISSAQIDKRGIKDDRGWLVVTPNNKFVTQREIPKMALIKVTVNGDTGTRSLKMEAEGMSPLAVPEHTSVSTQDGLEERRVTVWNDSGLKAIDQGDSAAEWLSKFLGTELRLVRMSDDGVREVKAEMPDAPASQVGFQDGYPFLIISIASLDDLNSRLEEPLPMNRFRPNIVVEGAEPFAEDNWQTIKIGDVTFECDKLCARCVITTIDQKTAKKNKEPLKTLATFRLIDNQAMFGQNAIHLNPGIIKVNDEIKVLKLRK